MSIKTKKYWKQQKNITLTCTKKSLQMYMTWNCFFNSAVPERQLNDETREKCEGRFSNSECKLAITKMKKNKSPGLDGISVEFYEKFWPFIGNLLVEIFNDSYENGILPDSQRVSVFTLIL